MRAPSRNAVSALAGALALLLSAGDVVAQCSEPIELSGLPEGSSAYFLDGMSLASPDRLEELDPEAIYETRVTCWNAETGEMTDELGVAGVSVVFVVTREHATAIRAPLEAFVAIQGERALAASTRVAGARSVPRSSRSTLVEFTPSAEGWSASTFAGVGAVRCFVAFGDAERAVEGMEEGEIVCRPNLVRAGRALRAMYGELVR